MRGVFAVKKKYYPVHLSEEDRKACRKVLRKDGHSGQIRTRASILLALDEGETGSPEQSEIARILKTSTSTVYNTAKAFSEGGVEKALTRKRRGTPPVAPKVTGEVEARVVQIACSAPPEGHARWTLRLIEDAIVRIDDIPDISDNTIGRILKKRRLSLT